MKGKSTRASKLIESMEALRSKAREAVQAQIDAKETIIPFAKGRVGPCVIGNGFRPALDVASKCEWWGKFKPFEITRLTGRGTLQKLHEGRKEYWKCHLCDYDTAQEVALSNAKNVNQRVSVLKSQHAKEVHFEEWAAGDFKATQMLTEVRHKSEQEAYRWVCPHVECGMGLVEIAPPIKMANFAIGRHNDKYHRGLSMTPSRQRTSCLAKTHLTQLRQRESELTAIQVGAGHDIVTTRIPWPFTHEKRKKQEYYGQVACRQVERLLPDEGYITIAACKNCGLATTRKPDTVGIFHHALLSNFSCTEGVALDMSIRSGLSVIPYTDEITTLNKFFAIQARTGTNRSRLAIAPEALEMVKQGIAFYREAQICRFNLGITNTYEIMPHRSWQAR